MIEPSINTPPISKGLEKATPDTSHDFCATEQIFHPRKPLAPVTKSRFFCILFLLHYIPGFVAFLIVPETHAYAVSLTTLYDSAQWDTGQIIVQNDLINNNQPAQTATSAGSLPIGGNIGLASPDRHSFASIFAFDGELTARGAAQITGSPASTWFAEAGGSASFLGTVNSAAFNTLDVDLTGTRTTFANLLNIFGGGNTTLQTGGNVLFSIDDITTGTNLFTYDGITNTSLTGTLAITMGDQIRVSASASARIDGIVGRVDDNSSIFFALDATTSTPPPPPPPGGTPVPEPSTVILLGIGLAGLAGGAVRRKWKKKAVDKAR